MGINFYIPENRKSIVINKKYYQQLGFPYQYFEGEVLTDEEVTYRTRLISISFMMYFTIAYSVVPTVGPVVGQVLLALPPTSLEKVIPPPLDSQTAPVIRNRPYTIIYRGEQIDEFSQISSEFLNGSISMEEAILQLRGGDKFKDISFIVLYIWLYSLQNKHVQGFQPICLPHQEWMPKGANQRPPYAGGYGSSSPGSSLGLANTNDGFDKFKTMNIKINSLNHFDAIDGNIWGTDEISFNSITKLRVVINLKTKVILGFTLSQENLAEEIIDQFYQNLLDCYDRNNIVKIDSKNNSNQLIIDSISERIQVLLTLKLIQKDSRPLRKWRQTVPKNLKLMSSKNKSKSKEFRRLLFESDYFQQKGLEILPTVISEYNNSEYNNIEFTSDLLPQKPKADSMTLKIQKENLEPIEIVKQELSKILKSDIGIDEKISQIAYFILVSQNQNRSVMKKGFVGLAAQNAELKEQLAKLQKELEIVSNELLERKRKEQLIEEQKERRKNRKRLPKRQPINNDIYQILIEDSKKLNYSNSYRGARLKLALAIMAVTGIRVSELLSLKMGQVKTLFVNHWIKIDRVKRGPSNHKAFLTPEGARIIKDRLQDFEFLYFSKDDNSYIFTAENSEKPLERESFTNLINQFIKESAGKIDGQPILSSHSFRIGFITQLWRDTNDIEFVRQTIGDVKIDTTSL